MEFLDSLDFETKNIKSNRVRSWYLYEQYKSLENHQLDAAQKLKDRMYQDRILRQELAERRARRKLYDQVGLCQSESKIGKRIKNYRAQSTTLSNDEYFESFSEQEDERVTLETEFDDVCSENLAASNCYTDDFKSTIGDIEKLSGSMSVNSVVERLVPNDNCGDCEFTRDNQFATMAIAHDLNKQLDAVQQNIESLQSIAKLEDVDKSSEESEDCITDNCRLINESFQEHVEAKDNQIILFWTRLVSFAYQIVQLNNGNCFCDYSSQFLTAVLAFDVLRRGVTRMCYHLQPYVSPIKYSEVVNVCDSPYKNEKQKKSAQSRKSRKTFEKLLRKSKWVDSYAKHTHKNYSENNWQYRYRCQSSHGPKKPRRASDTLNNVAKKHSKGMPGSSGSCKKYSKENVFKECCCYKRTVNPMLEIARYIDSILKDTK